MSEFQQVPLYAFKVYEFLMITIFGGGLIIFAFNQVSDLLNQILFVLLFSFLLYKVASTWSSEVLFKS